MNFMKPVALCYWLFLLLKLSTAFDTGKKKLSTGKVPINKGISDD